MMIIRSLLLVSLWLVAPVQAELFQGLLQTGKPSDAALRDVYGLLSLPLTVRTSFAGWPDGSTTPPEVWFDNAAAALNPPHGWVLVDHEDWPMVAATQAQRLATAQKFVTLYNGLKSRRPDLKFGFYSYTTIYDYYRAREASDSTEYRAWKAENDDMAAMAAVVDGFFPPIYYFFNLAGDGPGALTKYQAYMDHVLDETIRVRNAYGDPTRPIYPYIWWRVQDAGATLDDSTLLDEEVWAYMIEVAMARSTGPILWGGFNETWTDASPWWQTFRARLPKRVKAGQFSRPTPAAGRW